MLARVRKRLILPLMFREVAAFLTVGVLAGAERVTVRIALVVPALPSVTLTSPMLTDGAFAGTQTWSLIRTETLFPS